MRLVRLTCVFFMLVLSCAAQKKRVAVFDFEYGTVQSSVAAVFGNNQDVGKGISDMLVQKLVQSGKYSVIERKALDKLLAEQNFSNSERADPASAARIGKMLGVDAIIVGSITKFGRDDKSTSLGGVGFGRGPFGLGGAKVKSAKAVCGISARLVDTSTGEILAAVTGNGESKRSGTSLIGAGAGSGGGGGGFVDMSSSNFAETILGEAVLQAVDSTATQLNGQAGSLPTRKVEVSGLVADVSGKTIIINVGSKTGLKIGDRLEISHAGRTIKDPATGKVLKTITSKIGDATVTEIDPDSATATFAGDTLPKVGDVARTPQ